MHHTVLIIDDDSSLCQFLIQVLRSEGYEALCALTAADGLKLLQRRGADAVLLDMHLPDANGLAVLSEIKQARPYTPVLIITGLSDVTNAVESMKRGAYDYITKPFETSRLLAAVGHAVETVSLRAEIERLRQAGAPDQDIQIIGQTPGMRQTSELVARIAPTQVSILIQGPSGSGKEIVARQIHQLSPRAERPFIPINCAAIPDTLLESELFGYEAGAFTGALRPKKGLIESAHTGTLFLDEISGMKPELQAKLLRVLEDHLVRRLGSTTDVPVDIRILSASNQDLPNAVSTGAFRQDLYYRLSVITVTLPPLCERADDIPLFLAHFIEKMNKEMGCHIEGITEEALDLLKSYTWPGNVRELRNVIERALVLCDGPQIGVEHLPAEISRRVGETALTASDSLLGQVGLKERVAQIEIAMITQALEESGGNQTQAAHLLKLTRDELRTRLKRYHLE
jgi:two-component system response regulator AtoC